MLSGKFTAGGVVPCQLEYTHTNRNQDVVIFSEPTSSQLTIVYKGGGRFHVKGAKSIKLVRKASGNVELSYTKAVDYEDATEYGTAKMRGDVLHTVKTGDIKSIEVDEGIYSSGLRITTVVEI